MTLVLYNYRQTQVESVLGSLDQTYGPVVRIESTLISVTNEISCCITLFLDKDRVPLEVKERRFELYLNWLLAF